jgi:hypothetical protein
VALGAGHAAIDQRQLDILDGRGARQQIEALKDEAQHVTAQHRQLRAVEAAGRNALEQIVAGARHVETAKNVHRRRLAGAGRVP